MTPSVSIDWQRPQDSPRGKRYPVTCPACLGERFLRKSDALKAQQRNSSCFRCSQLIKAKKGYAATVKQYGADFAILHVQEYRLANPSKLEQQVIVILNALPVKVEREVLLPGERQYLIDFVINGRFAIEVNGGCHVLHEKRDLRKFNAIRGAGYQLLVLDEKDMPQAAVYIAEFLDVDVPVPV